jgi:uncharacterized protein (TIGR02678 family)
MIGDITRSDGQRAFVGLLTRPLLTPTSDPELHRQVARNMTSVEDHARRLGYRVANIGRVIGLVRNPIAGQVSLPPPPVDPPTRQVLTLTCVLAAACEETAGRTTIAKLSELVAEITNAADSPVTAYDQARVGHRRTLLQAAAILQHWGVLVRQLADDRMLGSWETGGQGIGTVYSVNREALLLLTNPDTLSVILEHASSLDQQPPPAGDPTGIDPDQWAATRAMRLLRALVETPVVTYDTLEQGDAETLHTMRGLRAGDAAAITGGHVEARAEGLVLILPDEYPAAATFDWPRAESRAWAALVALEEASNLGVRDTAGRLHVRAEQVQQVAAAIADGDRSRYLAVPMRTAAAVHAAMTAQLTALGLLHVTGDGDWVLSPAAGRYRNPSITTPAERLTADGGAPDDDDLCRSGDRAVDDMELPA